MVGRGALCSPGKERVSGALRRRAAGVVIGNNRHMRVERRSLLAGAADAQGIVVVIDVLRAFSCSALMFHYGVRDLALVRTPQEALAFRDRDPDYLVAGEIKGVKVEGFDLGNSPAEIVAKGEAFFRNRRVAVRSSAGTQGVLAAAANAEQVILGSYMTADAIARYIRTTGGNDAAVTIVAMGFEGITPSVEDERCGDYIEHLLTVGGLDAPKLGTSEGGHPYDHMAALWECLNDPEIAKSLRGEHQYRPKEDIVLALQRDLFDFAMVGRREDGHVRVTKSA